MPSISASVGLGGTNVKADVKTVQHLLNGCIAALGLPSLVEDGGCGKNTILAIQAFQSRVVGLSLPDGRIDPGGRTWTALIAGAAPPVPPPLPPAAAPLSGAGWWHANQAKYPNSAMLADLASPFREKAIGFIDAMKQAGAAISVSATLRDATRAKLMLYCWEVSSGELAPNAVPKLDGCAIEWDHGNLAASRQAAQDMVHLFGIVYKPSAKVSRHVVGCAVDMTISWTGTMTLMDAHGAAHPVGSPRSGETNTLLHTIGASYGVIKLLSDPPHWSDNGH